MSHGSSHRALTAVLLGVLSLLLFMASVHLNFSQRSLPIQTVNAEEIQK